MTQLTRVLVIVVLSGAVSVTALLSLVLLALGKLRGLGKRVGLTATALFVLGVLTLLYGRFIEGDWLEVTRETVVTKKWPKGTRVRIAHLSDLHLDVQTRGLTRAVEVLRKENVDLIVFTGDSLNERDAAPLFRRVMSNLQAPLGRYAVRGNHDTSRWADVNLFDNGPATELLSEFPSVKDSPPIALCGAPFNQPELVSACLANTRANTFTIVAFHTPDLVEALTPQPDLYLAGHTHGGQIALPFYGAVITFSQFDKKYEAGRYQVGDTTLYVNRGIGFEPHLPKIRLNARPELTIIDVVGE